MGGGRGVGASRIGLPSPAPLRRLGRCGDAELDLLAGYARRLDADIVALQEVDGPEAAARVFDPQRYAFFFADEPDVQRTGFAVRRGLAVRRMPDVAGLDLRPRARLSLRRGTDVAVDAPGGTLRLLSVHLTAGCRDRALRAGEGEDCADLVRQAEVLAGWVAARQREGVAFAILGDLNRRIADARDPFLVALDPEATLVAATRGLANPCWADAGGGRPFIDHLLLGGPAVGRLIPDSLRVLVYAERGGRWRDLLSDHCPVSLRVRGE